MKNLVLLANIFIALNLNGQDNNLKDPGITLPRFYDHNNENKTINDYLIMNVKYPEISISQNKQGTEIIQFTVKIDGKLDNFKIINSVCREIDKEVFRVLRSTNGKWIPDTLNGNPVAKEKEVSITFLLMPENYMISTAHHYLDKGNKFLFDKQDPGKALDYYNKGITLLPNDVTLLEARGLCKLQLGDSRGANRDWERLKILAERKETESEKNQNVYKLDAYYAKIDSLKQNYRNR